MTPVINTPRKFIIHMQNGIINLRRHLQSYNFRQHILLITSVVSSFVLLSVSVNTLRSTSSESRHYCISHRVVFISYSQPTLNGSERTSNIYCWAVREPVNTDGPTRDIQLHNPICQLAGKKFPQRLTGIGFRDMRSKCRRTSSPNFRVNSAMLRCIMIEAGFGWQRRCSFSLFVFVRLWFWQTFLVCNLFDGSGLRWVSKKKATSICWLILLWNIFEYFNKK